MPLTIQFGWSAFCGDEFAFPSDLNGRAAEVRGLSDHEPPLGFNVGELINESEIVNSKGSTGLSIKGHYPEKDGITACLLAAEAVTARGSSLTAPSSIKDGFSSSHLHRIRIS